MDGSVWYSDQPIIGRIPPRMMFWHPDLDKIEDYPRSGSCPVLSDRMIQAVWGGVLGGCERIPVVIGDDPEPSRVRTDYAAIHILPVEAPEVVNLDDSEFHTFLPGSPIWSAIGRLRFHEHALPKSAAFRIAQFRSSIFIQGDAVDRVKSFAPTGVRLVPLNEYQVDW